MKIRLALLVEGDVSGLIRQPRVTFGRLETAVSMQWHRLCLDQFRIPISVVLTAELLVARSCNQYREATRMLGVSIGLVGGEAMT